MRRLTNRRYAVRRRLAVSWLLVALAAMLPAAAPAAVAMPLHAELRSLTPANGATLAVPPSELVLVFNEDINPAFVQVSLTRAGAQVALAPATVTNGTVTVPLPAGPDVGAGAYRIAYRVVSADGHPVSGASEFTVTAAPVASAPAATAAPTTASPAPATAEALAPPATAVAAGATAGSSSGVPVWAVAALIVVVVAGVGAFWYSRLRLRHANRVQ